MRPVGGAVLFMLVVGCVPDREAPFQGSMAIRDTAGAEIVFSETPAWTEDEGWSLSSEPVLVLGPEVGSERFFYRIGDIERLDDGRLIVENRGSRELLVFDTTGVFLEAWGREGEGPDEFGRMVGLFPCRDDGMVETEFWRVTFFDARGRLLTTAMLPQEVVGPEKEIRGMRPDCETVFATGLVARYEATGLGTHAYPVQGFWASVSGRRIDTLGPFLGSETAADPSGAPRARFPFAYKPSWAVDGQSVYYGWGDRPEVVVLSPDGSARRLIRWTPPAPRITEAEWQAYEADRRSRSTTDPRSVSGYLPRDEHPRPTVKPYFGPPDIVGSAFRISDDGYLWVRHYTRFLLREVDRLAASSLWSIFDPEGRWLGELETPNGFEVRSIRDDLILGVWRDEFDVEEVRVYRILGRVH